MFGQLDCVYLREPLELHFSALTFSFIFLWKLLRALHCLATVCKQHVLSAECYIRYTLSSRCVLQSSSNLGTVRQSWHLEGQGDLVSRLVTPITHIVTPIILIINLLTKSS